MSYTENLVNEEAQSRLLAEDIGNQVYAKLGRVRLSINFLELFTTLIAKKIITPFDVVNPLTIPPNSTVVTNATIPSGNVSVVTEERIWFDLDNALSITVLVDGIPIIVDSSAVMARYQDARRYLETGAVVPAYNTVQSIITNNSSSTVHLQVETIGGFIPTRYWNAIISTYFDVILKEVGLKI